MMKKSQINIQISSNFPLKDNYFTLKMTMGVQNYR